MLFRLLLSCVIVLSLFLLIMSATINNNTARAQQQQIHTQTSQGAPIVLIPGLTQNILTIVSFLIGTSSFILGLRIQSTARTATAATTPQSSIMHKSFELLILALIIPSVAINIYGILLVGSHLYLEDAPYLLLLFALFIPAGAILFLVIKYHHLQK